jgi:predicted amidophosphoribosyltransferase
MRHSERRVSQRIRHSALDKSICAQCLDELAGSPLDSLPSRIATRPQIPPGFEHSHKLCAACLTLHRAGDSHDARCIIKRAGLALVVAGWTSGITEALRADLRSSLPRSRELVLRVLEALLHPLVEGQSGEQTVIVPVPLTAGHGGRGLGTIAESLARKAGLAIVEAIGRSKNASTRQSVAQRRARIVEEEYSLRPDSISGISSKHVLLIDDMITTGHTVVGTARLLREAGAASVRPIAIDRSVSTRVLQRLPASAPDSCPHRRAL